MSDGRFPDDGPTDPYRTLDPAARQVLHGEPTGDELVAAVYADPDSDEPRLVYGDYLIEHEDPRGEFVQLQLARAASGEPASDRERELLARHLTSWLGPLAGAVDHASCEFRRGFLARCKAADSSLALRDVTGHPMWLTVEELISSEPALVGHACLRSLRDIQTMPETLATLVDARHEVRIEAAGFGTVYEFTDPDPSTRAEAMAWRKLMTVGALTRLRVLRFASPVELVLLERELLRSPLGRQLTTIEGSVARGAQLANTPRAGTTLAGWDRVLREHPSLRRVAIECGAPLYRMPDAPKCSRLWLERGDRELRATLEVDPRTAMDACDVANALPDSYRTLRVVSRFGKPIVGNDDRWLRARLGRFELHIA